MPAQIKSAKSGPSIAVIGIDIGKNVFHLIGLDRRGAIVFKTKLSRSQLENRLANTPPCLIGMEACVGAHHLSRRLIALGHDARLMPAKYVKAFPRATRTISGTPRRLRKPCSGQQCGSWRQRRPNSSIFRACTACAPVLLASATATVNEIRAFLLDRGIAVAQGIQRLRRALPDILGTHAGRLSPRRTPRADQGACPGSLIKELPRLEKHDRS